jgi:MFS family permease
MSASHEVGTINEAEHRRQLRRAVLASTIGTAIEWYDFFLYSTVTGLVFARLYFPRADPVVGTLEAFGVYAVGFLARPIGAAIFGHYGDRLGRKAALIATLLLMGSATFLVALVPGYEHIGIWGGIILTFLRFIQGIGVGGEWGGSVLLSMEWAQSNRHRGFIASWPQFGVPAGLFLANLAVLALSAVSGGQFLTWGWRLPFLFSIVLVALGLYIRLGILETPVFARLVAERRTSKCSAGSPVRSSSQPYAAWLNKRHNTVPDGCSRTCTQAIRLLPRTADAGCMTARSMSAVMQFLL